VVGRLLNDDVLLVFFQQDSTNFEPVSSEGAGLIVESMID